MRKHVHPPLFKVITTGVL